MYLSVVVPVVCIMGPIGSMLASHCHRQVMAWAIYILDTIALVIIAILFCCVPNGKKLKLSFLSPFSFELKLMLLCCFIYFHLGIRLHVYVTEQVVKSVN